MINFDKSLEVSDLCISCCFEDTWTLRKKSLKNVLIITCKLINSANLYQFDILKYCLEEQPPPSRTSGLEKQMQCLQKMLQELKAEVTAL